MGIGSSIALVRTFFLVAAFAASTGLCAEEASPEGRIAWSEAPAAVSVRGPLPQPPAGVTDLKFREFFRMPVGPRGLEPTEKLLSLDGRRVRIVGYMVQQETPVEGVFILSPLPVLIGDADESLSDDLPPSAMFVHIPSGVPQHVPFTPGLISLNGTLGIGPREEAEGRVSSIRLMLDPELAAAITTTPEQIAASRKPAPKNR